MNRQDRKSIHFKFAMLFAVCTCMGIASKVSAAPSCSSADYRCFGNPDWRAFGWNDRADVFKNDSTTSNSCVYQDINFGTFVWFIPRNGVWYDVPDNIISSRWWTMGPNIRSCR